MYGFYGLERIERTGTPARGVAPLIGALVCLVATRALAHTGQDLSGAGFLAGLHHPVSGLDHVLAMLAVGMWGAQLGWPAIWALPVVFPLVMALGGVWGILGFTIPGVEIGVCLSVIGLGALIAMRARAPILASGAIVSIFAVFHGFAHGAELPAAASAMDYSLGFVIATGLLHLTGIGIGLVTALPRGELALRAGGGAISLVGWYLIANLLLGS